LAFPSEQPTATRGVIDLTEDIERLDHALETRGTIGQALGICMKRYGITDEQAFQFRTRPSQDYDIKLRNVAAHHAETTVKHDRATSRNAPADPLPDNGPRRWCAQRRGPWLKISPRRVPRAWLTGAH
jgi:hypothetical protein